MRSLIVFSPSCSVEHGIQSWVTLGLDNPQENKEEPAAFTAPGDPGSLLPHTGFPDSLLLWSDCWLLYSSHELLPMVTGPFTRCPPSAWTLAPDPEYAVSTLPDSPGSGRGLYGCEQELVDRPGVALVAGVDVYPTLLPSSCLASVSSFPVLLALFVFGEFHLCLWPPGIDVHIYWPWTILLFGALPSTVSMPSLCPSPAAAAQQSREPW